MIGKASSVTGSVAGIDYLREEGKGYELDRNRLLGETSKEIMQEFRMQQLENSTCKKPMFTAVISPDISDGKKLTDSELKEIGKEFMRGIGVDTEKQAYIMIVHTEKEHKHIHLYANRIQENGKAINDSFIGKKASQVAHNIAKSRGLVSAKELMIEKTNLAKELDKDLKAQIFKKHQTVMRSKPKTLGNYIQSMKKVGLEIQPTINKQGQIQGFRVLDKTTNINHKMSDINRSLSANNLIKTGMKNDLGIPFTSTLKITEKQQIQSKNIKNIDFSQSSIKQLKPSLNTLIPGPKTTKILGKRKLSKEEYLEALKYDKLFEEVLIPMSIHLETSTIEVTRQEEILKISDSIKKIEIVDEIKKSEKETYRKQNNLEL